MRLTSSSLEHLLYILKVAILKIYPLIDLLSGDFLRLEIRHLVIPNNNLLLSRSINVKVVEESRL